MMPLSPKSPIKKVPKLVRYYAEKVEGAVRRYKSLEPSPYCRVLFRESTDFKPTIETRVLTDKGATKAFVIPSVEHSDHLTVIEEAILAGAEEVVLVVEICPIDQIHSLETLDGDLVVLWVANHVEEWLAYGVIGPDSEIIEWRIQPNQVLQPSILLQMIIDEKLEN